MYNRYMRNDTGAYTRMPQDDAPPPGPSRPRDPEPPRRRSHLPARRPYLHRPTGRSEIF